MDKNFKPPCTHWIKYTKTIPRFKYNEGISKEEPKLMSLISTNIHWRYLILQQLICLAKIFDLLSVQTLFDGVKCHFESFADSSSSSTLVLWKFFVVPEDTEAKWKRRDARMVNLK